MIGCAPLSVPSTAATSATPSPWWPPSPSSGPPSVPSPRPAACRPCSSSRCRYWCSRAARSSWSSPWSRPAGSVVAAVAAGFLLNLRLLPFGLAVGETVGGGWRARLVGAQLVTDETVAFSRARPAGPRARAAFWMCGILLYTAWNLGTVAGMLAGLGGAGPRRVRRRRRVPRGAAGPAASRAAPPGRPAGRTGGRRGRAAGDTGAAHRAAGARRAAGAARRRHAARSRRSREPSAGEPPAGGRAPRRRPGPAGDLDRAARAGRRHLLVAPRRARPARPAPPAGPRRSGTSTSARPRCSSPWSPSARCSTATRSRAGPGRSGSWSAALAAWRRAPFVVVVLLAAGTAAGLRALGVP